MMINMTIVFILETKLLKNKKHQTRVSLLLELFINYSFQQLTENWRRSNKEKYESDTNSNISKKVTSASA